MQFTVKKTSADSLARTGEIETPHGTIQTPAFMPVGTQGSVKTLAPWEVKELGADIILGNTYHLHVRPGEQLIAQQGGLQQWSGWHGPILTDSGGYQAYSLGETRGAQTAKTTDEGVQFASHLDGKMLLFTPESVLDIQSALGSDIAMVLDDCPPLSMKTEKGESPVTKERVAEAVKRTTQWAERSINYWQKQGMGEQGNALFGIVQGGLYEDLRLESLKQIQDLPFDGIAVGGVAIESEGKDKINQAVAFVADKLDKTRPHYLMGVGEPEDLIRMVHLGIDMFDCVIPTRYARHGSFWTGKNFERKSITLSEYAADATPLDPECQCKICQNFSKSYLRHLFMAGEMFALRALSYHNLYVLLSLMATIRRSIEHGTFESDYRQFLA